MRLLVINSNRPYLAPFSHNTSVQTTTMDGQTDDNRTISSTFT